MKYCFAYSRINDVIDFFAVFKTKIELPEDSKMVIYIYKKKSLFWYDGSGFGIERVDINFHDWQQFDSLEEAVRESIKFLFK